MFEERHSESLRRFVIDALATLSDKYGTPELDPTDDQEFWSRMPTDPEYLKRTTTHRSWRPGDGTAWPDWDDFRGLDTYANVNETFMSEADPMLRVVIAYGLPYRIIRIGPDDLSDLERLLQEGMLAPQIRKGQFVFDARIFRESLNDILKSLSDTNVVINMYTPLRYVHSELDIPINPNCSIRPLTDREIGAAVGFGILPANRNDADSAYLPIRFQTAIVWTLEIDFLSLIPRLESFADLISGRGIFEKFNELDGNIIAAIGLIPSVEAVDRGEKWLQFRTSAQQFRLREGTPYAPAYFRAGPRSVDITHSDQSQIRRVVRGLEKRHIRKAVLIAIDRLLSAAVRHYPADSIVDLAISAESLFGPKQPGEATHKISLNAALFLADDKNKASDLRKFFKNVYSVRSGIVHGGNRGESTQYGKLIEMRQQLSTWMKRAIGEAIEELIENPEALDWEQRLDRHIDSLA